MSWQGEGPLPTWLTRLDLWWRNFSPKRAMKWLTWPFFKAVCFWKPFLILWWPTLAMYIEYIGLTLRTCQPQWKKQFQSRLMRFFHFYFLYIWTAHTFKVAGPTELTNYISLKGDGVNPGLTFLPARLIRSSDSFSCRKCELEFYKESIIKKHSAIYIWCFSRCGTCLKSKHYKCSDGLYSRANKKKSFLKLKLLSMWEQ